LAVQLWDNLGQIYFEQKQYRTAADSFARSVEGIGKGAQLVPGVIASIERAYAQCLRKTGEKAQAKRLESMAADVEAAAPPARERDLQVDVAQLARRQSGASANRPASSCTVVRRFSGLGDGLVQTGRRAAWLFKAGAVGSVSMNANSKMRTVRAGAPEPDVDTYGTIP
jgi:hypothetical protein